MSVIFTGSYDPYWAFLHSFIEPQGYDSLYYRVWLYVDPGYQHPADGMRHNITAFNTTRGEWEYLVTYLTRVSATQYALVQGWQDNEGTAHDAVVPDEEHWITPGTWHSLEAACVSGPSGGTRLWVDGVLASDNLGHSVTAWKPKAAKIGSCLYNEQMSGSLYWDDFAMDTDPIGSQ